MQALVTSLCRGCDTLAAAHFRPDRAAYLLTVESRCVRPANSPGAIAESAQPPRLETPPNAEHDRSLGGWSSVELAADADSEARPRYRRPAGRGLARPHDSRT